MKISLLKHFELLIESLLGVKVRFSIIRIDFAKFTEKIIILIQTVYVLKMVVNVGFKIN